MIADKYISVILINGYSSVDYELTANTFYLIIRKIAGGRDTGQGRKN